MRLALPDLISNSYFPAVAAIELGFFAEEGLDVELEVIFPVDKAYAALREFDSKTLRELASRPPRKRKVN